VVVNTIVSPFSTIIDYFSIDIITMATDDDTFIYEKSIISAMGAIIDTCLRNSSRSRSRSRSGSCSSDGSCSGSGSVRIRIFELLQESINIDVEVDHFI
jgi:hypothetical protein